MISPILTHTLKFVCHVAFTLLNFFVNAAFRRYTSAGMVWGEELREACHNLVSKWASFIHEGAWHNGDYERVVGHVAAIPLALKADVRGSRDLRELKGLLSEEDLGRLHVAPEFTQHCVDVIRTYMLSGACRKEVLQDPDKANVINGAVFIRNQISSLESIVRRGIFLSTFRVSRVFIALLKTMLGLWFFLLPFVLSEISGKSLRGILITSY